MRLCTFEVESRFGSVDRVGMQTPKVPQDLAATP